MLVIEVRVKDLTEALLLLVHEMRADREQREKEGCLLRSMEALSHQLDRVEHKIMSAISDFAAKQNAFNDRIDKAVDDLVGDVKTLNDLITQLQTSSGQITPEDQATLDQLQARASAIADKLEALDAQTPPTPPTA